MARRWWSTGDPDYVPASLPQALSAPAYVVHDGKLWVFGGYADGWVTELTTVYAFDPVANAWTTHGALVTGDYFYAAGDVIEGVAYMLGNNAFHAYDLTAETVTAPTAPADLTYGYAAVAFGGKLYWRLPSTAPKVYDPATDAWTTITAWPALGADERNAQAFARGDYIYVLTSTLFGRYDPAADSWTDLPPPPAAHQGTGRAFGVADDGLLIAGGYTTSPLATTSRYNFTEQYWAVLADMGTARSDGASGVLFDLLFVAGGEDATSHLATTEAFGDDPPPDATADVELSHDVAWPVEAHLELSWQVDRIGGADAGAVLGITHQTVTGARDVATVIHDPIDPAGSVGSLSAIGPVVKGSIDERVGSGLVANVYREDGVFPTAGQVAFDVTVPRADGTVRTYGLSVRTAPAPYGRSWAREGGVPIARLSTPSPGDVLRDHILSEVMRIPSITQDGAGYDEPPQETPSLAHLDVGLGERDMTEDDCEARKALNDAGGTIGRRTRLDLARAAVEEAGMGLVVLGEIPNATRSVPLDYRTEGATAASVLSDMLLASNPRVWYTADEVIVDGRIFAAGAGSTDPTDFLAAEDLVDDGASWDDRPGSEEQEPLLADYTERCEQKNPDAADPDPTDTDVPGTFETFETGSYTWWERSGQMVGPFDDASESTYQMVIHYLEKKDGRLVRERVTTKEEFNDDYNSLGLNQISTTSTKDVWNYYHWNCPDALVNRKERTMQRRMIEDIPNVSNTLGVDEYSTYTASEEHEMIYKGIPEWYVEEEGGIYQFWHAEGWLKYRREVRKKLDAMIAFPQYDVNGNLTGYEVELTYKEESRGERYTPIGGGLWHISTSVKTVEQRPVHELINPSAVEGEDDYGEMHIVDVQTVPVQNWYTVVTDQAPPQVSCPLDPCEEAPEDPYQDCVDAATRQWSIDHADWQARVAHNGPKRVWSIQANRLIPEMRVGKVLAGGFVASVSHNRTPEAGTTSFEVHQWLA